jgi:hypothetical protein
MSQCLKSTLGTIVVVDRMVKVLLKTIVQSNAELAAEQEKALVATTDVANTRISGINALAADTLATVDGLKSVIMELIPAVISINERQDTIEQVSQSSNLNE